MSNLFHGLNLSDFDSRLVLLQSKEEINEAIELATRSFAGSTTTNPEGVIDYLMGPDFRNGEAMYGPLSRPPSEERLRNFRWIMKYEAVNAKRTGFIIGIRSPDTKKLIGCAITILPKTGNSIFSAVHSAFAEFLAFVSAGIPPFSKGKTDTSARFALVEKVFKEGKRAATKDLGKFYYIKILAVNPETQGQGVGRALLNVVHGLAERDGAACYLETSGSRNATIYNKFGYKTVKCLKTFGEGNTFAPYNHEGGFHFMVRTPDGASKVSLQ